jgi:hypothetical protein
LVLDERVATKMEAGVDDELEKDGLSDEFRTTEEGLKWLKK